MFGQGYVTNGKCFPDSSKAIAHFKVSQPDKQTFFNPKVDTAAAAAAAASPSGSAAASPSAASPTKGVGRKVVFKQNPAMYGQGYVTNGKAFADSTQAIAYFRVSSFVPTFTITEVSTASGTFNGIVPRSFNQYTVQFTLPAGAGSSNQPTTHTRKVRYSECLALGASMSRVTAFKVVLPPKLGQWGALDSVKVCPRREALQSYFTAALGMPPMTGAARQIAVEFLTGLAQ